MSSPTFDMVSTPTNVQMMGADSTPGYFASLSSPVSEAIASPVSVPSIPGLIDGSAPGTGVSASTQGSVASLALPSSLVDFLIYILLFGLLIMAVISAFVFLSSKFEPVKNIERAIRNALGIAEFGAIQAENAVAKAAAPITKPIGKAVGGVAGTIGGAIKELEDDLNPFHERGTTPYISPDEADSDIQFAPKAGYCYVGKDKGSRTCAYVGRNDTCMSGKVYPTMSVCINPALRV